jgi:hypothetical protein
LKFFALLSLALQFIIVLPAQTRRPFNISAGTNGIDTSVICFAANPAALGHLNYTGAAICSERKFFLPELNSFYAGAAFPADHGGFALNAFYSGFNLYNETQLGLAYGRQIGDAVSIGLRFNYNSIRIAGYGKASAVSFETGVLLRLTDKIFAAVDIDNPAGGKFGKGNQEQLPSVYTAGFGYAASQKFYFSIDIIKEEGEMVSVNAAFQYKPAPQLLVKCIVSGNAIGMAARFSFSTFHVEVAAGYHQQLGVTPGLLLLFNFKKKNN